ncbi:MAG: tetratricopeptide repeat protein [Cyclobacteriaceae bacterium]|nr:tetratricopeptide repeat protein [Cyclobacteriaceae bacterium]
MKELIDNNHHTAESKALLSATYGLQMGYSPMKGILLGGKSSKLAEEAKTEAPLSPITWRVYGSSKYYTPASFGGDVNEAIAALEKSVKLFESKPSELKHNWLYLDTLVLLAQAYSRNKETEKATTLYQKALSIEPNYTYAKSLLNSQKS